MEFITFLTVTAPSPSQVEIGSFLVFAVPFIILVFFGFVMFIHPPRAVLRVSLLSGLVVGIINIIFDLLAYYAHWWHYAINGLIFNLPLPFYLTPLLIYGAVVYLLIWRFWHGRGHWFALVLLIGIPIFGFARDLIGAITASTYLTWDSVLAGPLDFGMWVLMFYAGYVVFRRLAPTRKEATLAK